ncbi:DUF6232 family protein [Actinoplanes sp. NPDC049316]|uniref:DUF6232 family protein n=1 Tax=Actinoplanes sp. NPDC049316 TaxID=3154727 RepID=UPI0034480276
MFKGPDIGWGGGAGRPPWRVLYQDQRITITSWFVEVAGHRIAIPELRDTVRCLTYGYPLVRVAAVTGGLEIALAAPFAVAYGSALMLCAGVVAAAGMGLGALRDFHRNPQFMTIEAVIRGHRVVLYRTRDRKEFGHVWLAMVRAIEDCRGSRP